MGAEKALGADCMNISIAGKIITLWGVLVFLGWAFSTQALDFFGLKYVASALLLWSVLMAIGLVATYKWFPAAVNNKVVKVWTVIVVVGMLINFANFYRLLPSAIAPYVYLHGWVFLTAIGFALTALWWTPKSKMIYAAGAVLNVILLGLLLAKVPQVMPYGLWLAAIVAGGPIVLDGLLNYDIPKPAVPAPQASAPRAAPKAPGPSASRVPAAARPATASSSAPRKLVVNIVPKK
ncbi:hypothetical protein HYV43_00320 [Candidatus Micrarchaeota archaeon]|nr:hypothetical protein [Candidatus Micrarchaeota archaeon]